MIVEGLYPDCQIREAFKFTTDGVDCPISRVYKPAEFLALSNEAGLDGAFCGAAISINELIWCNTHRFSAILDKSLRQESRHFLTNLTFNNKNIPLYYEQVVSVDGCYRLYEKS